MSSIEQAIAEVLPDIFEGGEDLLKHAASDAAAIPAGRRNATLASLAGKLRRAGLTSDDLLAALSAVNTRGCAPPLSEHEVGQIATSISKYLTGDASNNESRTKSRRWQEGTARRLRDRVRPRRVGTWSRPNSWTDHNQPDEQ